MPCPSVEERLTALENAVHLLANAPSDDDELDSELESDHSDNPPLSPITASSKCVIPQSLASIPAAPSLSLPSSSEQIPSSIPISPEPDINQWAEINGPSSTTDIPLSEAKSQSWRQARQTILPPFLESVRSILPAPSMSTSKASLKLQLRRGSSFKTPLTGTYPARPSRPFQRRSGSTYNQ